METKKLLKSLKRRLGLITAMLAMLVVSQGAFAWGYAARDTKTQDENPSVYVGSTITFSWCVNGTGNGASYKRVGISSTQSSFGTSYDPGYPTCGPCSCEGGSDSDPHYKYQYTYTATSAGTKYYSLWLGWGSKVGEDGRYYDGNSSWTEGMDKCSGTSFTVSAVPAPTACSIEVTNAISGTGTSSDPYIVRPSDSYTVKLTATTADASLTGYGWNINSTSSKAKSSTTNTYTNDYTAGTAGSSAEYTGYAWHYNGSTSYYSSSYATSSKIYVSVQAACNPPTIDSTNPDSRCGTGTVTIGATASAGTVKWYDAATSGTFLNSGDSFTTPSISETTTYYAEADDNGCISTSRTSVTATVNSIPTITANDNSRCGAGDITLTATPSSGASVDWYDSSTGDNKVAENTTSLTVQGVTVGSPVTRYAEAVKNGCKSSSRDQAVATAKLIPAVSNIALTGSGECGTGDVTFTATATENSTITWYDGGSSKGTDNPITISIAGGSSKTLTAKATLDGCEESTGMSEEGSRKAAPAISASTTNTTAYEVITLSTNLETEVTWSRDVADTKAYFVKDNQAVDGDTVDAVSVNFKAPAKGSAYTITAKNKNNDCTSNLNITIGEPQEVCN